MTTLVRLLSRTIRRTNYWERRPARVPLRAYGRGSVSDFRAYFEGTSTVPVKGIADVQNWLAGCAYASDLLLFGRMDYWQHPCAFEQRRVGDCEDFALWAWRKLVCLGYNAEFVAGFSVDADGALRGHTWILLRSGGNIYLFDPVLGERAPMLMPLSAVKGSYIPEVSVGPDFTRYAYNGCLRGR